MAISYEEIKNILADTKDGEKVLKYIDDLLEHISDIEGELLTMISASKVLEEDI